MIFSVHSFILLSNLYHIQENQYGIEKRVVLDLNKKMKVIKPTKKKTIEFCAYESTNKLQSTPENEVNSITHSLTLFLLNYILHPIQLFFQWNFVYNGKHFWSRRNLVNSGNNV